jgi:hypothetical protein
MRLNGIPYAVFVDLTPDDHRVTAIRVVADPAELTGIRSPEG